MFHSRNAWVLIGLLLAALVVPGSAAIAQQRLLVANQGGHNPPLGTDNGVIQYNAATGALVGGLVSNGSGGLNDPLGLEIGVDGSLLVSSANTDQVLRYNISTGAFLGVHATLPAGCQPLGMTIVPGFLYVTCQSGSVAKVERLDAGTGVSNGTLSVPTGSFPNAPVLRAVKVHKPTGRIYVLDYNNGAVHRFDGTTLAYQGTLVAPGSGGLGTPSGMVIGADNNLYIPMGLDSPRIKKYDGTTGAYLGDFATWAPAGPGGEAPLGIAIGPDGHFYMATQSNNTLIRKVTYPGAVASVFAAPNALLANPFGLVFARAASGGICSTDAGCSSPRCAGAAICQ